MRCGVPKAHPREESSIGGNLGEQRNNILAIVMVTQGSKIGTE